MEAEDLAFWGGVFEDQAVDGATLLGRAMQVDPRLTPG